MGSELSPEGAITAFSSGLMIGLGWALLNNDRFKDVKEVLSTAFGGGIFVTGLYLWAPAALRRAWVGER